MPERVVVNPGGCCDAAPVEGRPREMGRDNTPRRVINPAQKDRTEMDRFVTIGIALTSIAGAAHAQFATNVVDFVPGMNANPGFGDASTALGSPARFTGVAAGFPGVVSPFNPAFGADQIVQIGEGGSLTLELGTPARNSATNPFGVDLLIFGNAGMIDADFPNGQAGSPAGFFGLDNMLVSVSADGTNFVSLGSFTEGFFPTMGYADSGAFDSTPGSVPTSFTTPMDPSLTLSDFDGLDIDGLRSLYGGSGGGTPIDIAGSGLESVRYVRIDNPLGSNATVEIDAVSVVPTPASGALLALAALGARRRRTK